MWQWLVLYLNLSKSELILYSPTATPSCKFPLRWNRGIQTINKTRQEKSTRLVITCRTKLGYKFTTFSRCINSIDQVLCTCNVQGMSIMALFMAYKYNSICELRRESYIPDFEPDFRRGVGLSRARNGDERPIWARRNNAEFTNQDLETRQTQ